MAAPKSQLGSGSGGACPDGRARAEFVRAPGRVSRRGSARPGLDVTDRLALLRQVIRGTIGKWVSNVLYFRPRIIPSVVVEV
jgi:hypothetical protein